MISSVCVYVCVTEGRCADVGGEVKNLFTASCMSANCEQLC